MREVCAQAPIEDVEVETLVIAECYFRLLQKFTFFPAYKKAVTINLKQSEAWAINKFFAINESYNILLRMQIEPKIINAK